MLDLRFVFVLTYLYRQGENIKKPQNSAKNPVFWQKQKFNRKFKSGFCKYTLYIQNLVEFSQKTPERRDRTMAKSIKEIMIALNQVLTTTVWVNEDRQIVSLADELQIGHNNAPRSIEDLPRPSLVGAYVSLQIRTDNFDVAAETLDTKNLALRVKEMVFTEAKKIMDAADGADKTSVARAA